MKVYGPPGIERVVAGFNEAYAIDNSYRTKHHGAAMLPPGAANLVAVPITIAADTTTAPVFETQGLKVTAVRVKHEPANPAYGYRFDFAGRSVTVSGDTIYDEDLARAAQGSDVLVHEALSPQLVGIMRDEMLAAGRPRPAKIMHDIPGYHTTPVEAARIANLAHVKLLIYTHLLPILPNGIAIRAFLKGVSDVRPDGVRVGHDGLIVRLPGGGSDVLVGDVESTKLSWRGLRAMTVLLTPPYTEEILEQCAGRRRVAGARHDWPVMAGRLLEERGTMQDRSALGILGGEHQARRPAPG